MPGSSELPLTLQEVAFRHAVSVRPDPDFHHDMDRLIQAIKLRSAQRHRRSQPLVAKTLKWSALLGLFIAVIVASQLFTRPRKQVPETPVPKNAESLGVSNGHLESMSLQRQPRPAKAELELAARAQAILKQYCHRCHGVRFEVPGYNVLDRESLVARRAKDEDPFVTPGKPESSEIWKRAGIEKDMPPSGEKPSDSEREVLRQWIVAGAYSHARRGGNQSAMAMCSRRSWTIFVVSTPPTGRTGDISRWRCCTTTPRSATTSCGSPGRGSRSCSTA